MEMVATFSVYFRINIATKLLKIENLLIEIEAIFIEINIKSNIDYCFKWYQEKSPWKKFPWKIAPLEKIPLEKKSP